MKFNYLKLPSKEGKSVSLPLIKIGLPFSDYTCLVDSGADFSYFDSQIGELLGLEITEGEQRKSKGITGMEFIAYFHKIKYKIGGWEFEDEIGFSDSLGMPFGILGREGLFNHFKVCFNHLKEEIELKPINK